MVPSPAHAVHQQDLVGGEVPPSISALWCSVMLNSPNSIALLIMPPRSHQRREVGGRHLAILLVDRDGEHIGLDGGRIARFGAQAHRGFSWLAVVEHRQVARHMGGAGLSSIDAPGG